MLFTNFQCRKQTDAGRMFMGRLELKGPCGQYTITVLKGKMKQGMLQPKWTDPTSGKTYKNVFAVANSCSFPANELHEGDEFLFTLGGKPQNCMVCQIYYPTPEKKLMVAVTRIIHKAPANTGM